MSTIGSRPSTARRLAALVAAAVTASALAACGSSGSHSGSDTGGAQSAAQSGAASASKTYAAGVPTLNDLYQGTETKPPTQGPKPAKGKSVIFVSCGQAAPGCAGVPNEMATPAKLLGWKYRIIDGRLNADNGWANGVRQAIAAKPDAIVVHGMNCQDVQQPLEEAAKANIPVMGLEDVDCNDKLLPGGGSQPLFKIPMEYTAQDKTGGDYFYRWGATQAAYLVDATQGKAKIIRTVYQPIFGAHQKQGQDAVLSKCSGCKVVANIAFGPADQTPNGPLFQKFVTTLQQHPEANAVLMNFDTDANTAGLAKAIVDAGRQRDVTVVAGEGYAAAKQAISNDQGLNAEAAHDGHWMAWGAVDNLNRFFTGQPPAPEGVGFRIIDKGHNMMPPGKDYATPIDYRAAYKALWGLTG
jgi:ribose transport system substrate-binding protein